MEAQDPVGRERPARPERKQVLLRIDPANEDVKRFVAALMGSDPSDEDEPAPKPAPRKKTRSKR